MGQDVSGSGVTLPSEVSDDSASSKRTVCAEDKVAKEHDIGEGAEGSSEVVKNPDEDLQLSLMLHVEECRGAAVQAPGTIEEPQAVLSPLANVSK